MLAVGFGRRLFSTQQSFAFAAKNLSPAHIRHAENVVVERASGCRVYPVGDSKGYIDFTCGIGVTNTGHNHPRVVQAIKDQADKAIFTQMSCYMGETILQLTEELRNLVMPEYLDTVFLVNSGTEATENAVKIARAGTGRQYVIAMEGCFHGRSYLTMAMTSSKTIYRKSFGPMPGCIEHAPYPYAYRYGWSEEETVKHCLRELQYLFDTRCHPSEVAAIIMEPVLGEGGYVPAPTSYLKAVQKICNDNGIVFIIDEVQSGFCRTGDWFAYQHSGVRPDIMIAAKGIASGMPLAVVMSARHLHKTIGGSLGTTFGGSNAITAAAALATIQVMKDEKLCDNARVQGAYLMEKLKQLQKKYPVIGDVRGRGLMIGMEFTNPKDGRADAATPAALKPLLIQNRLLLLGCGTPGNVFRWIPPLVVTRDVIDEAVEIFDKAMQQVTSQQK